MARTKTMKTLNNEYQELTTNPVRKREAVLVSL